MISVDDFYQQLVTASDNDLRTLLPSGINKEIGHVNVFSVADLMEQFKRKPEMPYNRRAYYKISLNSGQSRAEYADKVIDMAQHSLLFASPKVPYNWYPTAPEQGGYFCIFTAEFLAQTTHGTQLDELPIFKAGGYPVFQLTDHQANELTSLFQKMQQEMASDYAYKYDLLRAYVLELIHFGQKLQPATALYTTHSAAARVSSLFVELLERQFPIESPRQRLALRTANQYADRLAVHVNHLNKVLNQQTGRTTTDAIQSRVVQEAKILLKQTDWTVTEIAWCLGFDEVAYFSNFFRKHTSLSPIAFRSPAA